jgi:hypothetical protein
MRHYRYSRRALVALAAVIGVAAIVVQASSAAPLVPGQVLAGSANGLINQYTPIGTLSGTLDNGRGTSYGATGMCFNGTGNLFATTFNNGMTQWDATGTVVPPNPWTTTGANLESCTFDAAGNMYVGDASSANVTKIDPSGTVLATYPVATEDRGTDWVDLAADQKTLFYTSEGSHIKRFDVSTSTQLADFASLPTSPCYALRIRTNGQVMVACTTSAFLLDATGAIVKTYSPGASLLFGLNLDPDGTSFWTGDLYSGQIWHIDIATGTVITTFFSDLHGYQMAGLAVVGEIRAAVDNTPPSCSLFATVAGPPKQIQITVQDTGSGLGSVAVTTSTNATVSVPSFSPGDTSAQMVVATKTDQTNSSSVALTVTDQNGNVTKCDPLWPGTKAAKHNVKAKPGYSRLRSHGIRTIH